MVSYTSYDVWTWLNYLGRILRIEPDNFYDYTPFSDSEIVHFLTHETKCLGWMVEKRATPIAEWAINIALKKGYLKKTDGGYLLSKRMAKKNGRPTENE